MAGEVIELDRHALRVQVMTQGVGREDAQRYTVLLLLELIEKVEDLTEAIVNASRSDS